MEFSLTPEQLEIQSLARDFTRREVAPRARHTDETSEFDRVLYEQMAELGFVGMMTPQEYGGAGSDNVTWCLVVEEVSKGSAAAGNALQLARSVQDLVRMMGSDEQRRSLLPGMASGKILMSFGLTEPNAGSDAASLQTTARKDGADYLLNGQKQFITLSGVADYIAVAASLDRSQRSKAIRVFLVPRDAAGLTIGSKLDLLGMRGMATCPLFFQDCRVSQANILGPDSPGFRAFMHALDGGRLGVSAQAVGQAQAAFDAALSYATQRVQFGKPIAQMQAVEEMLANMAVQIEAARLMTLQAAWRRDANLGYSKQASMAKLFASEVCMKATLNAMQVFGGYSYSKEYPVERYFRDAKIHEIWDGTSQIQHMIIARHLRQEAQDMPISPAA